MNNAIFYFCLFCLQFFTQIIRRATKGFYYTQMRVPCKMCFGFDPNKQSKWMRRKGTYITCDHTNNVMRLNSTTYWTNFSLNWFGCYGHVMVIVIFSTVHNYFNRTRRTKNYYYTQYTEKSFQQKAERCYFNSHQKYFYKYALDHANTDTTPITFIWYE